MPASQNHPFSTCLHGQRIHLELTSSRHTSEIWSLLQRDRAAGGNLYHWVECQADVSRYITEKPNLNVDEIDYLIFKNDRLIGSFHVHSIRPQDHQAEIGYALEKNEEGHGYASEALKLVETELFRLGFRRIMISCAPENSRSIRVAQRNGFRIVNQTESLKGGRKTLQFVKS